jgi:hypothetical protein
VACIRRWLAASVGAQFGKKTDARLDTFVKVREMKFFVGSMDAIIGKPKAHQHDGDIQRVVYQVDYRDGAAIAKKNYWSFESLLVGVRRGNNRWMGSVN